MKIAPAPLVAVQPVIAPAQNTGTDIVASAPAEPQDKVSQGSDFGNMVKLGSTGLTTLFLSVPCAYAGIAGGALVGGVMGGALGPVTDAFTGGGVISALGSAWHTAGTMGHWGMAIGALTALTGSYAAGSAVGNGVGHLLGVPKQAKSSKPINWSGAGNMVAGTTLLTAGIASGTTGGLALGAGAGAAGTVLSGLFQHGFNAAALVGAGSHAALFGGVGAAVAGTVCMLGAASLTKGVARNVIDPATVAIKGHFHKEDGSSPTSAPKPTGTLETPTAAKLINATVKNPVLMSTNLLDAGIGASVAMGATAGMAADLLNGGGYVLGAYHAVKAAVHLLHDPMKYETRPTKADVTKMTGEILNSVGMFSAAAGVGPVSLAFLGLGMIVTTAATLNEKEINGDRHAYR